MSFEIQGRKTNFYMEFDKPEELLEECIGKGWVPNYKVTSFYNQHTRRRKNVYLVQEILKEQSIEEALDVILKVPDVPCLRHIKKNLLTYDSIICDLYFGGIMDLPKAPPNMATKHLFKKIMDEHNNPLNPIENPRMCTLLKTVPILLLNQLVDVYTINLPPTHMPDYLAELIDEIQIMEDGWQKAEKILEYFVYPLNIDCIFNWLLVSDAHYAEKFIEELHKYNYIPL